VRKTAAERKRDQRIRDGALAEAGLMRLPSIKVPETTGDYLRGCGFMPPTSEDDPASVARGVEKLIVWLQVHKDDLESRDSGDFRDLP
jgi:hypothetical protein